MTRSPSACRLLLTGRAAPEPEPRGGGMREIQLRYRLAVPTFKTLCEIPQAPDRRRLLHQACLAHEVRSFPIKQAERGFFRDINDHSPIPYPVAEAVSQPWHKVFLLSQIDLERGSWPARISADARRHLHQERGRIYALLYRVLRCLTDILGHRRDGRGVGVALNVLRSVKAGVWEGSDNELLQVDGIGPVKRDRLVGAGVRTVRQLSRLEFYHVERLPSRNPPFGHKMLHQLAGFPVLTLQFDVVGQLAPAPGGPDKPLLAARVVLGYDGDDLPLWNKKHPWTTFVVEGEGERLLWFWRGSVKRLVGGKELVVGLDAGRGEQLQVTFACEIVGTMVRSNYRA